MSNWHDIGAVEQFDEGCAAAVVVAGQTIAIFRVDDEMFALHDRCTHGAARLSEGYIDNGCVECPLHQGRFDLRTGAARSAPLTKDVRRYPLRIIAGRVELLLGEA